MVESETIIKKYASLKVEDIADLLENGHEMKIQYIAQTGYRGNYDSENQPIKEPFGIIEIKKGVENTIIKINPSEMVALINLMAKRK